MKCDETKPACKRCTDTGRTCDGYAALAAPKYNPGPEQGLSIRAYELPFSIRGNQQERKLFHFYCTQSAPGLSAFVTDGFWYSIVLQQSRLHTAVRQAVLALGASHLHNLTTASVEDSTTRGYAGEVQVHREMYYKAIRSLRKYLSIESQPDPRVVSICCALFFCYENAVGDSDAALKHLESGLQVLKGSNHTQIDRDIIHLFVRLDCQATLFDNTRSPSLNILSLPGFSGGQEPQEIMSFATISECQQHLDILFSRLTNLLLTGISHSLSPAGDLPAWIVEEKRSLEALSSAWDDAFTRLEESRGTPRSPGSNPSSDDDQTPAWSAEEMTRLRLNRIHHAICSMFLAWCFPLNEDVFSASPNAAAEKMLDLCASVADSMVGSGESRPAGLTSETGVLAPLFMLALKCADDGVRRRATDQIRRLREYKEGLFDADALVRFLESAEKYEEAKQQKAVCGSPPGEQWEEYVQWPDDDDDVTPGGSEDAAAISPRSLEGVLGEVLDEAGGVPAWYRRINLALGSDM